MKDHAITAVIGFLTLIIGSLLGYYVDLFKDDRKNQVQYLDIRTESNKAILRKLSTKNNGEVNLTWNGNLIDSVSKITVDIYNFSNKDFEDVPVFIDLALESGKKVEIIDIQGEGESGVEDHQYIDGYPKNTSDNSSIYGVNIEIINRTTSYKPGYRLNFLIKGAEIPSISVSARKKGIKSQGFTSFKFDEKSFIEKYLPFIIIIIFTVAYISFFVWLLKHSKKRALRRYGELVPYISDHLDNLQNNSGDNAEVSKGIIQALREFRWGKLDRVDRLIFQRKKPAIEELEEELNRVAGSFSQTTGQP